MHLSKNEERALLLATKVTDTRVVNKLQGSCRSAIGNEALFMRSLT